MNDGVHLSSDERSISVHDVCRLPDDRILDSPRIENRLNLGLGVLIALTLLTFAWSFLADRQSVGYPSIREELNSPITLVLTHPHSQDSMANLAGWGFLPVKRPTTSLTWPIEEPFTDDLNRTDTKAVYVQIPTLLGAVLAFLLGMGTALFFRQNLVKLANRFIGTGDHLDNLEALVQERTAKLEEINQQLTQEIAERVQAESHRDAALQALQESEERYRTVSELTSDYADALKVEPDGSLTREWVTGAFTRITGYTPEELPPQNGWKRIVHPDDFPIFERRLEKLFSGEPDVSKYRIITKWGEVRWLRAHGRPIWDEAGGRVVRYVGAARDISERVWAEEQLERYATQLTQSNEELKQFTYIVSHDLRAPLVNLKGFAAELRSAMEVIRPAVNAAFPGLDDGQKRNVSIALEQDIPEALGFIDSSVTRMDGFINALLGLSRLGRRQLDLKPVDMEDLIRTTLNTLAHQIEERGVNVTVGPLPDVVADQTSMAQILGNILDNAVKYLDPDRPAVIDITAEQNHTEVIFRIRDNGRGIDEADMDKVFAPFRRAGRQDVPGEGMGLSYVQALVRLHCGRIWCESELGVGTTLAFTVPNQLK